MRYCNQCLQPDTRPNSKFSASGVCPACEYFERLQYVNWEERFETLLDVIERYKAKKNRNNRFDCIIGVSGGKDSSRQALWIRDKLKLNPLLVCLSYPPEQVTERGTNNLSNLINLGFDVVVSAPAPVTWRKLMRHSFERFTNWARSTELALYSSVPSMAIRYQIPLIFWGENPALQLGDLSTLGRTGYDGNNLRNMNTLNGGVADWIRELGIGEQEIIPYNYPTPEEFDKHRIQIVYLGWFLGDWSLINNGLYAITTGLKMRDDSVKNTGDLFGVTALDEDWVTVNQMIKYYKYGFGRVSDYVNEEIRLGRMSRTVGIELVDKYDHSCSDKYVNQFCTYIGISVEEFWNKVRSSLDTRLFDLDSKGRITKKFRVGHGL